MICDKHNIEEKTIIKNVNFNNKDVLEVGCGVGRYANFICSLCKSYTGIDVNENAILTAKEEIKFSNANFICDNFLTYNFRNSTYDIIVMCLTFHEFSSEMQGLALLKSLKLLKKDGKIIIVDPRMCNDSFQALYDVVYNNFKYYNHCMDVKHSNWVLKKLEGDDIIKLIKTTNINVDFEFENIEEVIETLISDEAFEMLDWDKSKRDKLLKMLIKFVEKNNLSKDGKIVVYDKLILSVFEKG